MQCSNYSLFFLSTALNNNNFESLEMMMVQTYFKSHFIQIGIFSTILLDEIQRVDLQCSVTVINMLFSN